MADMTDTNYRKARAKITQRKWAYRQEANCSAQEALRRLLFATTRVQKLDRAYITEFRRGSDFVEQLGYELRLAKLNREVALSNLKMLLT
jgi:hypothetical protein